MLALRDDPDAAVVRIDTGSEHPDNDRFANDCAAWFRRPIEVIKSDKYADTWDVWESTRWLVGPGGARCTAELKRRPRMAYERPDDRQVFGYTVEEQKRADRFREQNPEIDLVTPLIDAGLTKSDCHAIIERAGIDMVTTYKQGYPNANCLPCVKATSPAYWARIKRDYPDKFDRMATLERSIGVSIRKTDPRREEPRRLWLDELDVSAVDMGADEPDFECSLMCHMVNNDEPE